MKFAFLLFLVILLVASCEGDGRLSVKNESINKIRYYSKIMDNKDTIPEYCDSIYYCCLLPNAINEIHAWDRWEFKLRDKPNKILRIFIISEDTFKKYSTFDYVDGKTTSYRKKDSLHNYDMCDVFKKRLFLKRYDLKFDDLIKADWQIVYDDFVPFAKLKSNNNHHLK